MKQQTIDSIQIILIDDCSDDNTVNVIKRYAVTDDRLLLIQNDTNRGPGYCRNVGLKYVDAKYVVFLDSDDFYPDNNTLKRMYDDAIEHNADIVGGQLIKICSKTNSILSKFYKYRDDAYMFTNDFIQFVDFQDYMYYQRYMFSMKLIANNDIMFPQLYCMEDPVFLLNVMTVAQQFYGASYPTYVYVDDNHYLSYTLQQHIDQYTGIFKMLNITEVSQFNYVYEQLLCHMQQQTLHDTKFKEHLDDNVMYNIYEKCLDHICMSQLNDIYVSIIVVCYNCETTIDRCIQSILTQSYRKIQLIVVNDGSTDATFNVISKYENDSRLQIISNHVSSGCCSNPRNQALQYATGKYVMFVDGDDYLENDSIHRLMKICISNDLDYIMFLPNVIDDGISDKQLLQSICNYNTISNDSMKLCNVIMSGQQLLLNLLNNDNFICSPWNRIMKLSLIDDNSISFPEDIIHEDNYFSYVSLMCAQNAMLIDDKLYNYCIHDNSIMSSSSAYKHIHGLLTAYDMLLQHINTHKVTDELYIKIIDHIKHKLMTI